MTGGGTPAQSQVAYVVCGNDTEQKLAELGDPEAIADSTICDTSDACAEQGAVLTGGTTTKQLKLIRLDGGKWSVISNVCVTSTPPQVTAALVRNRVVRLIPPAALGLAPHGATLVNIETVMWVDADTHRALAPVQILGRTVRITLHLDHVNWHFGDGDNDTTSHPGHPYEKHADPCTTRQCPDYYGHTYERPGRVRLNATASWTVRFTVDGGNPITIPGTVTGPTAQAAITIKQARGVLIPNPGQH